MWVARRTRIDAPPPKCKRLGALANTTTASEISPSSTWRSGHNGAVPTWAGLAGLAGSGHTLAYT